MVEEADPVAKQDRRDDDRHLVELEAVGAATAGKLERLEAAYHVKFERIVTGHKNREKALKGQVAEPRGKKAAAAPGAPKAALNATRENRLGYLESKLEQGRADIAAMPAA